MRQTRRIAAVQMTSTDDMPKNLATAQQAVEDAAAAGAQLVVLPENFAFLGHEAQKLKVAQPIEGGEIVDAARGWAREYGLSVLLGSIAERGPTAQTCYNTSVWLEPTGEVLGVYRKIHLFDVDLPGAQFCESRFVAAGEQTVVVPWHGWSVGLSICYDLRFPEMYRVMSAQGMDVLMVPAAFTAQTGPDHWEPLVRARAIENQCYLVAANQVGEHGRGRASHGHSVILDPWGNPLARATDTPEVIVAQIDAKTLEKVRERLPALTHRRF